MHPLLDKSIEMQVMKLGLEHTQRLDEALGSPSKAFRSIHVAGTNGKGSVATKISRNLQVAGHRVGLFTSPHISSYRERVCVNGVPISEEDADRILKSIVEIEMPSYFELATLLALCYFAEQNVDIAVLEVGIGGRLDSTNIIIPELSIITSISIDHVQILGSTIEEIAFEKAGIIKPKVPVLLGPKAQPRSIFTKIAEEKGSRLFQVEGTFADYEEENRAIVREALRILDIPIDEEAIRASPPCRFERKGNVILDVAHNRDGFVRTFQRIQGPVRCLMAFAFDKEVDPMVKIASECAQAIHLTEVDDPRGFQALTLEPKYTCFIDTDLERAFETAHRLATEQGQTLLVCGTFLMMDFVRTKLEMEPVFSSPSRT